MPTTSYKAKLARTIKTAAALRSGSVYAALMQEEFGNASAPPIVGTVWSFAPRLLDHPRQNPLKLESVSDDVQVDENEMVYC